MLTEATPPPEAYLDCQVSPGGKANVRAERNGPLKSVKPVPFLFAAIAGVCITAHYNIFVILI